MVGEMTAAKPLKGIPRKPMRRQLRGVVGKVKLVKIDQKQRHGKYLRTQWK